jgi:hypothetical protein
LDKQHHRAAKGPRASLTGCAARSEKAAQGNRTMQSGINRTNPAAELDFFVKGWGGLKHLLGLGR